MIPENFDWKKFYFSFEGRVNRKAYWLNLILPYMLIGFLLNAVDVSLGLVKADYGLLSSLFSLICLWPHIALGIKRFHDRDLSGWWQAAPFVATALAVAGFVVFKPIGIIFAIATGIMALCLTVQLLFLKGTTGPNKYGPDPLGGTAEQKPAQQEGLPSSEQDGSDKKNFERVGAGE